MLNRSVAHWNERARAVACCSEMPHVARELLELTPHDALHGALWLVLHYIAPIERAGMVADVLAELEAEERDRFVVEPGDTRQ
jgi:hypothetical protein